MHLTRARYRLLLFIVAALGAICFIRVVAYTLQDDPLDDLQQHADGKSRNSQAEVKLIKNVPQPPAVPVIPTKPASSNISDVNLNQVDPDKVLVLGRTRNDKGFLTIGIPTSLADGAPENLERTLKMLIQNTEEAERPRVTIVVFTRDFDPKAQQAVRSVVGAFTGPLQSGLLRLIEAPRSHYRTTASEKNLQVKESLDMAFLISYSKNISEYYLQLNDNVKTVPGYVRSIRDFIKANEKKSWVSLEFSSKKFTGKLIRSGGKDQATLIHFLMKFGNKLNVGLLYESFKHLSGQKKPIVRLPALFEDLGNA